MDKEMLEQFQMLMQGMVQMENRLNQKIQEVRTDVEKVRTEVQESETRTKVFIENEVTKRIDTLFDGYKLTHEKQWELERETENLKRQMDDLQSRLAAVEAKLTA